MIAYNSAKALHTLSVVIFAEKHTISEECVRLNCEKRGENGGGIPFEKLFCLNEHRLGWEVSLR